MTTVPTLETIEALSKGLIVLAGSANVATARMILDPDKGSYTVRSDDSRHHRGDVKYAFDIAGTKPAAPTILTRYYAGSAIVTSATIEPNAVHVNGLNVIDSTYPYALNIELRTPNGNYTPGVYIKFPTDIDVTAISTIADLVVGFIRTTAPQLVTAVAV